MPRKILRKGKTHKKIKRRSKRTPKKTHRKNKKQSGGEVETPQIPFNNQSQPPLPEGNQAPLPEGNQQPLPEGNQQVPLPETNQQVPLPETNQQVPLPEGNQVPLPEGNQQPFAEGNQQVPLPEGNQIPLPEGNQVPLPEGNQVPLPEGNQVLLPEGNQLPPAENEVLAQPDLGTNELDQNPMSEGISEAMLETNLNGQEENASGLESQLESQEEPQLEGHQLSGTFNRPDKEQEIENETLIEKKHLAARSGLFLSQAPVNADKETELAKKQDRAKDGTYPMPGFSTFEGLPDDDIAPKILVDNVYPKYLYSATATPQMNNLELSESNPELNFENQLGNQPENQFENENLI